MTAPADFEDVPGIRALLGEAQGTRRFVQLETTNPANYAFYDSLGFTEPARLRIGADGPELRALRLG